VVYPMSVGTLVESAVSTKKATDMGTLSADFAASTSSGLLVGMFGLFGFA
jgi:hypothetical protein